MSPHAPISLPARRARHRRLVIEAAVELGLARLAIGALSFRRAVAFGAIKLGTARPVDPSSLAITIATAVTAAAARVPFRAVCFPQAIALQRMARRRGIDAILHYGAAQDPASGLAAHVWVTVAGKGLLGHEQADRFGELLRSPQ